MRPRRGRLFSCCFRSRRRQRWGRRHVSLVIRVRVTGRESWAVHVPGWGAGAPGRISGGFGEPCSALLRSVWGRRLRLVLLFHLGIGSRRLGAVFCAMWRGRAQRLPVQPISPSVLIKWDRNTDLASPSKKSSGRWLLSQAPLLQQPAWRGGRRRISPD